MDTEALYRAAHLLKKTQHAVALTGAGVSVESGIPPFRGRGGLWERYDPEKVASLRGFRRDPGAFWEFAQTLMGPMEAQPNPGHEALACLEERGLLQAVLTQNIDGLHQKAGSQKVLELHGSLEQVYCLHCGLEFSWSEALKIMADKGQCQDCASPYLKPDIVFFGEALPEDVLQAAFWEARNCEVFLVIGSSLEVYPVAQLPAVARDEGAKTILINRDRVFGEREFDVILRGNAKTILPRLLELWES